MPWTEADQKLTEVYTFKDFKAAFAFMTEVAEAAEAANHHPTWTNTYNTVKIELTTHDEGNEVTDKDHKLAAEIDRIRKNYE